MRLICVIPLANVTKNDMEPQIGEWVWHDASDPAFSRLPALVVATEGAPASRGSNSIALMFDAASPYWLSRDRIRPCSREQAVTARRSRAHTIHRSTLSMKSSEGRTNGEKTGSLIRGGVFRLATINR